LAGPSPGDRLAPKLTWLRSAAHRAHPWRRRGGPQVPDSCSSRHPNECGDFCGTSPFILAHFNTSQFNSQQGSKLLKQMALQGFLPSFQRVSKFVGKGFLNRGSGARISPGLPLFSAVCTRHPREFAFRVVNNVVKIRRIQLRFRALRRLSHGTADDTRGLARRLLLSMDVVLHRRSDAGVSHLFLQRLQRNSVFGQLRPVPVAQQEPRGSGDPKPIADRTKPATEKILSWFSVKWRVAVFGKLLCSAASRRGFSRHGEIYRSR